MPKLQEKALIVDQQSVAQQTYRMRLESPEISRQAKAGQFVMLQVREGLDPLLRRPFSFHRIIPEEGAIEILYKVVGRGTHLLSQCGPGARLNLLGPLGNSFEIPKDPHGTIAAIAGGIGIAPLFELLIRLSASIGREGRRVHLFYGARTAAELLPAELFSDLGIVIHWSTDDGSFGYNGYVTKLFQQFSDMAHLEPSLVYACGPLAMQYHVAQLVMKRSIASQLSLESLMACGVGACLGCALPARHPSGSREDHYVHVCKDGPIFSAGSIQWQKIQSQQMSPPIFLCI